MKQAIDRSRALQIERKQKENAGVKQEEKEFAQFWNVRNQELQLAEQQERDEEKQRQLELVQFTKKQGDVKRVAAEDQFKKENVESVKA